MYLRRGLLICASIALLAVSVRAEDIATERAKLAAVYAEQLAQLAAWCDENSLPDEAAKLRAWRPTPEPLSIALYTVSGVPSSASSANSEFSSRFENLRTSYARSAFELAKRAVAEHDPAVAVQLVYETLREDPNHAEARRLLGYERNGDRWLTSYEREKTKAGQVWHEQYGWLPREHVARYEAGERYYNGRWMSPTDEAKLRGDNIDRGTLVLTEHFGIRTNADLTDAVRWASEFERLYQAWRQLYIAYCLPEEKVTAALLGHGTLEPPGGKRFEVVLFRTRDEYTAALSKRQPQIAATVGYYDFDQRKSYLFAESDPRYVLHELVHQFFFESRPTVRRVGQESNFWIVEGSACYFESLVPHEGYVVLGGIDGGRMGSARGAMFRDDFFVPLAELCRRGRLDFQRDPKVAWLYAESAGLTHFFMHAADGRYRPALVELLTLVFTGKDKVDTLATLTNESFPALDDAYRMFLEQGRTSPP